MKCTIKDVARAAGVSPSTVSRVMSGSSRISEETCSRIRRIMEEMNYQPNLAARSLVSQSANSVGIFMKANPGESLKHPFFAEALRGLSVRAAESELQLVFAFSLNAQEDLNTIRRMVSSGAAGGMILLSSQANDPVADYLSASSIPFVVIGRPDMAEEHWWVDNDNILAGRLVTEHLLSFGHRRIMLLGAKDGFTVTQLRQQGYEQALEMAGVQADPSLIFADPRDNPSAIHDLFFSPCAPTAVIAMDDSWALWLMGQLGEWGLSVPKDVSMVGFNNSAFSPFTTPPLTSVEIHSYELGLAAMDMIMEALRKTSAEPRHLFVPVSLIQRGSVRKL